MARPLAPRYPIQCTGIIVHGLEKRASRQTECRRFIASIFGAAMVVSPSTLTWTSMLSSHGGVSKKRSLRPYQHLHQHDNQLIVYYDDQGVFWDWWHGPSPSVDSANNRPIPSSSAVGARNIRRPLPTLHFC